MQICWKPCSVKYRRNIIGQGKHIIEASEFVSGAFICKTFVKIIYPADIYCIIQSKAGIYGNDFI